MVNATPSRKAARVAIESLAVESLATESPVVKHRDKDILQRGNLFPLSAGGNLGCQLRRAKLGIAQRTWAHGGSGRSGKVPADCKLLLLQELWVTRPA